MDKLLNQLQSLKIELQELKKVKVAESSYQ